MVVKMSIDSGVLDGAALVKVSGEIANSNVEEFDESLARAAEGGSKVVLDLSGLDMITSSGLGTIIKHTERLGNPDKMILVGLKSRVLDIFKALGLDQFFVITLDMEEALRLVGKED